MAGRHGPESVAKTARSARSVGNRTAKGTGEWWTAATRIRGPGPDGIEGGEKGEAGVGRGRPESVGRSPSKLAQQRAECGVCGIPPCGVGRRFGGFRRGGGFGPLPEGFQV